MGLVSRIVAPEALRDSALSIAADLARGPTVSYGFTKSLLQRGYALSLDAFLEAEGMAQAIAFGSEDFSEGVDAFRTKRKASFQGR